ncbi:hypothetical protein P7K49_027371, partial [Saguinus oedipus]
RAGSTRSTRRGSPGRGKGPSLRQRSVAGASRTAGRARPPEPGTRAPISAPRRPGTLREKTSSLLLTDRKARRLQNPRGLPPPALAAIAGPGCVRTCARPPFSTPPNVTPPPPCRTLRPGARAGRAGTEISECRGPQSAGWARPGRAG